MLLVDDSDHGSGHRADGCGGGHDKMMITVHADIDYDDGGSVPVMVITNN